MLLETRKKILGTIIASSLIIFPIITLAGTGPNPSALYENFFFSVSSSAGGTTYFNVNFPSSTGTFSVRYGKNVNFTTNPIHPCWNTDVGTPPEYEGYWYGGSGGWTAGYHDASIDIPITTGTITMAIFKDGTGTTTPIGISSICESQASSTWNWTSSDWDMDTVDLDGSYLTSEKKILWEFPTSTEPGGGITSPNYFSINAFNLDIGKYYRYRIQGYGSTIIDGEVISSTIDKYFPSFLATEENVGSVYQNSDNLFIHNSSGTWTLLATLSVSEMQLQWDYFDDDQVVISVNSPAASSIFPIWKPYATSSLEAQTREADCGDWYQFRFSCHLMNFFTWLFIPEEITQNVNDPVQIDANTINPISSVWYDYATVFPFSIFTTVVYQARSSTILAKAATSSELRLALNIAGQTSSILINSPTLMKDHLGIPITNIFYNFLLGMLSLLTLTALMRIIMK